MFSASRHHFGDGGVIPIVVTFRFGIVGVQRLKTGTPMREVGVYAVEGRSDEQKKSLVKD